MLDRFDQGITTRQSVLGDAHVAAYAGVPKTNHAIKPAKQTFNEMGVTL